MINFTYDQAYKLWYDIKTSVQNRDPAANCFVRELYQNKLDNYIKMCQVMPIQPAPSISINDTLAVEITSFYQSRKQQ